MINNSINVIQEWMGEDFTDKTIKVIEKMPDNQLIDLLEKLASSYYSWREQIDNNRPKEFELLQYGKRFGTDASGRKDIEKHAKLCSLCYENVAFGDPLAEILHATIEIAQIIGVDPVKVRKEINAGTEILLLLLPLVKSGAITLIPQVFISSESDVQKLALLELGDSPRYIDLGDGTLDSSPSELALLSAVLTTLDLSPVASTTYAKTLLEQCSHDFQKKISATDIEIENVLSHYEIPNITKIPISEIVSLRQHSEAFYKCRKTIQHALSSAHQRVGRISGGDRLNNYEEYFKEHIVEARKELSTSVNLRDLVLQGGIGLGIGALNIYLDNSTQSDLNKVIPNLLNTTAPIGIYWLINTLLKRINNRTSGENSIGQMYSYLTE